MTNRRELRYFFPTMRIPILRPWRLFAFLSLTAWLIPHPSPAADSLEAGFQSPPDSAKPQTWWHWMNGNITKEGITADLEAMKQIGLGGAEIFNADCGIPAGPVKFNSPEWHEMFQHAVREADRLGLQLEAHNCAGWSSSGGPWNVASNGMMHVVTSEIHVSGPTNFSGILPEPPTKLDYYRDIAVLAFRTPDGEEPSSIQPKVATSVADIRNLCNLNMRNHFPRARSRFYPEPAPATPVAKFKRRRMGSHFSDAANSVFPTGQPG
jgi:hypothetical protein